jgi:hypothetical protein
MKTLHKTTQMQTRPAVERAFPIRRDLRAKAEAIAWENKLSDWEWIMLWANIYSGEMTKEFDQPASIRH